MHHRLTATFAAVALSLANPVLAQQPVSVRTIIATQQPVTTAVDFVGRVEAIDRVEIRARVTGFLDLAMFKEGESVKRGDKLFQIDAAPFEAALQQSKGALLQAQATLANASLQLARASELVKTAAVSVATRDQSLAAQQSAMGAVEIADADLKAATINLGYTTINAPITGRIGRATVTKGNVVGPSSGAMVLIVSEDPVYVVFPVSQRDFLRVRLAGSKVNRTNLTVKLQFSDGSAYDHDGTIDFVDITVNKATDTVTVRATVPNPDRALTDGQFMRVAVQGDTPAEKIVIPQAALLSDQEGVYAFVVEDGKAVPRRVKLGTEIGIGIAIEQGLSVGDHVVVSGLQSLRPGAAVVASPAIEPAKAS